MSPPGVGNIQNKLKDNPFLANEAQGKTENKKNVRASIQRMAASSSVSSNPWRSQLKPVKPPPEQQKPSQSTPISSKQNQFQKSKAESTETTAAPQRLKTEPSKSLSTSKQDTQSETSAEEPAQTQPSTTKESANKQTADIRQDPQQKPSSTVTPKYESAKNKITDTKEEQAPTHQKVSSIAASLAKKQTVDTKQEPASAQSSTSTLRQQFLANKQAADAKQESAPAQQKPSTIVTSKYGSTKKQNADAKQEAIQTQQQISPVTAKFELAKKGSVDTKLESAQTQQQKASSATTAKYESLKKQGADIKQKPAQVQQEKSSMLRQESAKKLVDIRQQIEQKASPSSTTKQELPNKQSTVIRQQASSMTPKTKKQSIDTTKPKLEPETTPTQKQQTKSEDPVELSAQDDSHQSADEDIDYSEMMRELQVTSALLAANEFATLSISDAEKWHQRHVRAKASVAKVKDRVLSETQIQRSIASMLKLACSKEDWIWITDVQQRAQHVEELVQELYYTFSYACECQAQYLQHIAGTLASVNLQQQQQQQRRQPAPSSTSLSLDKTILNQKRFADSDEESLLSDESSALFATKSERTSATSVIAEDRQQQRRDVNSDHYYWQEKLKQAEASFRAQVDQSRETEMMLRQQVKELQAELVKSQQRQEQWQRERQAILQLLDNGKDNGKDTSLYSRVKALMDTKHSTGKETQDLQAKLDEIESAFRAAQEEYTRREAAWMLQSASVEAELGAILKEYDRLTRNITDFNHERKKYETQITELRRERQLLDKQVADYKIQQDIGKDGQTMTLRKEFRQLMATVKAEHQQELQKEIEKRRQVELELSNIKHDLEMKRWDTVSTAVQTHYVAYPPSS